MSSLPVHSVAEFTEKKKKKNLLLVKMKEKKLLKMQSLPKVLRSQAMSSLQHFWRQRSVFEAARAHSLARTLSLLVDFI
jgi:hypothetical protein